MKDSGIKTDTSTQPLNEIAADFRSSRLSQVLVATQIAVVVIIFLRIMFASWHEILATVILSITLGGIYYKARTGDPQKYTAIFLWVLSISLNYFMWRYEGLGDEVLFAFPSILVMSVILGTKKLFFGLMAFMVFSIVMLGTVNSFGWYTNPVYTTNVQSGILISIILLTTSFFIWLLANDLRKLLKKLTHENIRVLRSQEQVEKLLHHDALTNLPNRILARSRFEHAMAFANRESTIVCLMFIDLDNFKNINDSLGHKSGDLLLKSISVGLVDILRETDCVCRLGGDEFLVILESIQNKREVVLLAEKILDKVREPVDIDGNSVSTSCSIGIALSPDDGVDFDIISSKADMAMYRAKETGRNNFRFFDHQMNKDAQNSISLIADLQSAILNNELSLSYQPKIDLNTSKVTGAEALLSWQHPERGSISPDVFIPLAESSGMIIDIGRWVIEKACADCKYWVESGYEGISVAVNVSTIQFKRGNISSIVINALDQVKLPGNLLELELTESLLIDNYRKLNKILADLRQAGVRFSIDDFGTGYSNLSYLKNFEVESLKVDKTFVQRILQRPQDKAIVTAIIQMAKSLNMKTIAEGIESGEVYQLLKSLDCDVGQGYYWSKAISLEKFTEFLRNNGHIDIISASSLKNNH